MEKAKAAVQDFISRDGKHKTTVDEDIRAPVTEEHIKPHHHDNVTTAVDRSVHVDHHHTTVQPITHKETLPEQHSHNIMPVEHKTVHHGNERELKDTLDRDTAKYQDSSTTHHTTHSASTAPVAVGERTHHHVHEHVQPVIQKEVVAPQVVHTTVPVHETHHVQAQHHGTSVLPAKTMEEFHSAGAGLEGRAATKVGEFDGQPKPYDRSLQTEQLDGDRHMSGATSHHQHHHREGAAAAAAGAGGVAAAEGLHHHHDNKHREAEGLTGTSTGRDAEGFTGASGTRGAEGLTNTGTEHSSTGHHYGRDAAVVGGTAAAAEGLHHHHENKNREAEGLTGTSTTRGAEGLSNTRGTEGLTSTGTGTEHSSTGHHHGRDAAAVGTTAAAADGLHHHQENKHHNDGLTSSREAEGLSSTRGAEGLSSTRGAEGLTGTEGSHHREGMPASTTTSTNPTSTSTTTGSGDRAFFSGPHDSSKLTAGNTGDLRENTGISEKINNEGAFGGPGVATSATSTEERKPSLADKLNPFKDADGDGKKGFMH